MLDRFVLLMILATAAVGRAASTGVEHKLVERCGVDPIERRLRERAKSLNFSADAERDLVRCAGIEGDAKLKGVKVPIKLLENLSPQVSLKLDGCLVSSGYQAETRSKMLQLIESAVTRLEDADRRMRKEYASCYVDVVRCGRHPCSKGPTGGTGGKRSIAQVPSAQGAGVVGIGGAAPGVVGIGGAAPGVVGIGGFAPQEAPSATCTNRDLALTLERDGDLIPGRRKPPPGSFASGRLYQFSLTNISATCTVIVKNVQVAVLATVVDQHPMLEATTAENRYEVDVSPDVVGQRVPMVPIEGAPRTSWSFHYSPRSAPDRFAVEVIPRSWGHSYAIQFVVTWYDPASRNGTTARPIEYETTSEVLGAFFPEGQAAMFGGSDTKEFRESQMATWKAATRADK